MLSYPHLVVVNQAISNEVAIYLLSMGVLCITHIDMKVTGVYICINVFDPFCSLRTRLFLCITFAPDIFSVVM